MGVQLDDRTTVDEALNIYPHVNDWWIPLGKLSEDLGLAIQISAETENAEGFIIKESNRFSLNLKTCTIEVSEKRGQYPCDKVFIYEDEIYVLLSVLSQWLPIEIRIEPLLSLITITPKEKLPLQLRRERESSTDNLLGGSENKKSEYPLETNSPSAFSGPTVDETLTMLYNGERGSENFSLNHSTGIGAEFIGLNLNGFIQGRKQSIDGWRLQFSKEDPGSHLMGPLHVKKIQILDVDTPAIPLLTEGGTGKGVLFSSLASQTPAVYNKQDFVGVLKPGWEVLLYRNDILIDRQTSNPSGIYRFTSVPLLFGQNIFKLRFFGPRGEIREEHKVFNINSNFVGPGEDRYWFSLLMARPSETIHQYKQRALFNFTHGFSQNISVGAGFAHERETHQSLAVVQLLGANSLFNLAMNGAISNSGGKAFEWSGQTRLLSSDWTAKYSKYLNFRNFSVDSNFLPLDSWFNGSVQWIIPSNPAIGSNLTYDEKKYVGGSPEQILKQNLSTQMGLVNLSNELMYIFTSQIPIQGKVDAGLFLGDFRTRATLTYSTKNLIEVTGDLSVSPTSNLNATLVSKLDCINRRLGYGFSLTKALPQAAFSLDLTKDFSEALSVGLTATFSLVPDPESSSLRFSKDPQVRQGYASIQVCIDLNRNGLCENGEPPLSQIQISLNGRDTQVLTDSEGRAFFAGLTPYQSHEITIKYSDLNDPFLKIVKSGIRFYPEPSKVFKAMLPVVYVGAIEGTVTRLSHRKGKPKKRFEVILMTPERKWVSKVKTDREGLFTFEDIPPGRYLVKAGSDELTQEIEIPDHGGYVSNVNFTVKE